MSIKFNITGTMSGTVRRSISIYININNSIIIEGKIFRLALTSIQICILMSLGVFILVLGLA